LPNVWKIGRLVQFPFGTTQEVGIVISSPTRHFMVGDLVEVWVKGEIKKIRLQDLQQFHHKQGK
jgi:hypothetical protein